MSSSFNLEIRKDITFTIYISIKNNVQTQQNVIAKMRLKQGSLAKMRIERCFLAKVRIERCFLATRQRG